MTSYNDIFSDAITLLPVAKNNTARCKAATSRFYYSAFHAALAAASLHGYNRAANSGMGVHQELRQFLAHASNRDLIEISEALHTLFDRRVIADYRLKIDVEYVDLEDSRDLAKLIIQIADDMKAE